MSLTDVRAVDVDGPGHDPAGPARTRLVSSGRVRRAIAVVVLVVLVANVAVIVTSLGAEKPSQDRTQVVAAAVALASTASAEVEVDLDPFAGIAVPAPVPPEPKRPVVGAVDPSIPLPVPKVPPSDPYAATPEVRHGTLEIPAIGLSQTLFEGVTLTAINRGPSHWPGTAMPGEVGNVVVAGHRTTYSRPFWDLQAVQPGNELVFAMANGDRYVYLLDQIQVVSPTDVHIIEQTHARTATLFACHPRGSARQRIVGTFTFAPDRSTLAPRPAAPMSATTRTV